MTRQTEEVWQVTNADLAAVAGFAAVASFAESASFAAAACPAVL